ncbi:MAG: hypothetical protein LBI53_07565 [Candidatus Peribacteria bacterium]|nr:hypothetical protein [Candidatus Peribacteria bacterium]
MFFSYDHLYQAYQKARKSKTYNKEIVNRSLEEEINLQQLYHELITEKYIIGMPTRYVIQDPVLREIIAIPFRDRIVQHLIHQALYPIVEKQAIHDVYSNRI